MRIIESFPRKVREIENCWIPLADGCRLGARIWLPADAEQQPVPAILEYLPYRKRGGTDERDQLSHPYFAGHGYAAVRVDLRGSGESDGLMADEYLAQEQDDALEVIDWLAAQPWCDGKVGIIGISWGGFNGLQIAQRRPPQLKAVVAVCFTDDRYADDVHFKGGCLLGENMTWGAAMMSLMSRPPDRALLGSRWREMWLARLRETPFFPALWLRHQQRDAYWRHGSICEDFAAIEAAVLAVSGWGDPYSNAVPRLLVGLKAPVRAIIGPWMHRYPHIALPEPRIGFLQECLRWWDQWLKGIDTGIMTEPAYRAYMQESQRPVPPADSRAGRWVTEPAWPSAHIATRRYRLAAGRLGQEASDECLSWSSPQTVGAASGDYCPSAPGPGAPADQREDDAGSLVFETEPLAERLEILGAPVARLRIGADQRAAFVVARLNDVHPDGAATRISYGTLNLCHRRGHERAVPLRRGVSYRVRVPLHDVAYAVPPGHRLRLALSSAYWPLLWPSPDKVTLHLETRGCRFDLPVRPPRDEAQVRFAPAECARPLEKQQLRAPESSQRSETDPATGIVTLHSVNDFGESRNLTLDLTTSSVTHVRHSIHADDPLSACAEVQRTQTQSRGDWRTRTETHCRQWSDATHFHLSARIEAFEDDALVFERDWIERIPRDGI